MAAKHLKSLGYRIIQRNFNCGFGEIDIICRDGECLVFVEVKALTSDAAADPENHVMPAKMRQIERATKAWLHARGNPECPCRFDVISVVMPPKGKPIVRHIIEAFQPTRWCR